MKEPVCIVSAARTPIGAFGGSLGEVSPVELGVCAAKEALRRAGLDSDGKADAVSTVIVGNVLGAGHGMNLARQIALGSGCKIDAPAFSINMVCGSGLRAVALGAREIECGNAQVALVGGVESMSRAAFVSLTNRFGQRLGHAELWDLILRDGLTDAFHGCHMGITAENLASRFGISREAQDEFALRSQQKAAEARSRGLFRDEIVAVALTKRGKVVGSCSEDEHIRPDTTLDGLRKLSAAFQKDGTVTAGNASGINDGAAMLVLASRAFVKERKLACLGEITAEASAGVEPLSMGLGPVPAVQKALARAGLSLSEIDWIEANEAFAAQALAVSQELSFDRDRVNPLGGAIALGHPIGASGARILVTLLYHLKRTGKRHGLATLCVGGGQGVAMLVRAV